MCFTIPLKVLKVNHGKAIVENGKNILLSKDMIVKKGDYLQVVGNTAVSTLTSKQGIKVRQLIKNIYS